MNTIEQKKEILDFLITNANKEYRDHTELAHILDYMREDNEPCYQSFRRLMNRVMQELAVEVRKIEIDKRQKLINFDNL